MSAHSLCVPAMTAPSYGIRFCLLCARCFRDAEIWRLAKLEYVVDSDREEASAMTLMWGFIKKLRRALGETTYTRMARAGDPYLSGTPNGTF